MIERLSQLEVKNNILIWLVYQCCRESSKVFFSRDAETVDKPMLTQLCSMLDLDQVRRTMTQTNPLAKYIAQVFENERQVDE